MHYPRVLSIAGSDSGGGAGIQADIKTLSALGCYAMTAITAITVQNTQGVSDIHAVPVNVLEAQIEVVLSDIGADAIKIGMLHSVEVVRAVVRALDRYPTLPVVLDPVMVAASGDVLITPQTVSVLVAELFPRVSLITPNLDEAVLLLQRPLNDNGMLEQAAQDLLELHASAVLLKGAHMPGDQVLDVFVNSSGDVLRMQDARVPTANIHGSGCTLSSAVAAFLAQGMSLPQAVAAGRDYTRAALIAGAEVSTGQGHGPLNHGFAPRAMQIVE